MDIQFTSELLPLFTTPVMIINVGREFTEEELNFLLSLEQRPNTLNQSSCEQKVLDNKILTDLKKAVAFSLGKFFLQCSKAKRKDNTLHYAVLGQLHY